MGLRARSQLAAVAEARSTWPPISPIDVWLRGGWAMAFYLGKVTRRHEDVDWFAWLKDLPTLVDVLISQDWMRWVLIRRSSSETWSR